MLVCFLRVNYVTSNYRLKACLVWSLWKRSRKCSVRDVALSLQAIIQLLLTKMKACGTLMTHICHKRLQKTLQNGEITNRDHVPALLKIYLFYVPYWQKKGRDNDPGTGRHSAPPTVASRVKNWFENPTSVQAGTEGIIVLIVLILCSSPPPFPPTLIHPITVCLCLCPLSVRVRQPTLIPVLSSPFPLFFVLKQLFFFRNLASQVRTPDNALLAKQNTKSRIDEVTAGLKLGES